MECSLDSLSKHITYKVNSQINEGSSTGFVGNIKYTPKITEHFIIKFYLTAELTKGYDLNYLERAATLQGVQEEVTWVPKERADLSVIGSLTIDLEIPLPNVQYAEKFVLSGSAKIKAISDFINPQNSYNISGVIISGKILF